MLYRTLLLNHQKDFSDISTNSIEEYDTDNINIIKDLKSDFIKNNNLIENLDIIYQGTYLNDDTNIKETLTDNQLLVILCQNKLDIITNDIISSNDDILNLPVNNFYELFSNLLQQSISNDNLSISNDAFLGTSTLSSTNIPNSISNSSTSSLFNTLQQNLSGQNTFTDTLNELNSTSTGNLFSSLLNSDLYSTNNTSTSALPIEDNNEIINDNIPDNVNNPTIENDSDNGNSDQNIEDNTIDTNVNTTSENNISNTSTINNSTNILSNLLNNLSSNIIQDTNYTEELQQLQNMGFTNRYRNIEALQITSGNIEQAVNILFSDM